ncbi:uncharacterized protein EKO05_0004707 [Ascochyta rabiei]|uniref:uncharacterized protein n=1 Tax=Didymella rabiei TaxID=5454 RepID=UPI0018FF79C8|nr:uncharacterized protein EKO05_0004707 [Ascochyta rabiei]UPX14218.1 hypothetical protein EKO05_0004707 [Ascochyta rabiei]
MMKRKVPSDKQPFLPVWRRRTGGQTMQGLHFEQRYAKGANLGNEEWPPGRVRLAVQAAQAAQVCSGAREGVKVAVQRHLLHACWTLDAAQRLSLSRPTPDGDAEADVGLSRWQMHRLYDQAGGTVC